MKAKMKYAYQVGGIGVQTREAARLVQRALRNEIVEKGLTSPVPRILQKLTVERVVR